MCIVSHCTNYGYLFRLPQRDPGSTLFRFESLRAGSGSHPLKKVAPQKRETSFREISRRNTANLTNSNVATKHLPKCRIQETTTLVLFAIPMTF